MQLLGLKLNHISKRCPMHLRFIRSIIQLVIIVIFSLLHTTAFSSEKWNVNTNSKLYVAVYLWVDVL